MAARLNTEAPVISLEQARKTAQDALEIERGVELSFEGLVEGLRNLDWENISLEEIDIEQIGSADRTYVGNQTGDVMGQLTRGRLSSLYRLVKDAFPAIEGDEQEREMAAHFRLLGFGLVRSTDETNIGQVIRKTDILADAIRSLVERTGVREGLSPWILWDPNEFRAGTKRTVVGAILAANQKPEEETPARVEEGRMPEAAPAIVEAGPFKKLIFGEVEFEKMEGALEITIGVNDNLVEEVLGKEEAGDFRVTIAEEDGRYELVVEGGVLATYYKPTFDKGKFKLQGFLGDDVAISKRDMGFMARRYVFQIGERFLYVVSTDLDKGELKAEEMRPVLEPAPVEAEEVVEEEEELGLPEPAAEHFRLVSERVASITMNEGEVDNLSLLLDAEGIEVEDIEGLQILLRYKDGFFYLEPLAADLLLLDCSRSDRKEYAVVRMERGLRQELVKVFDEGSSVIKIGERFFFITLIEEDKLEGRLGLVEVKLKEDSRLNEAIKTAEEKARVAAAAPVEEEDEETRQRARLAEAHGALTRPLEDF